MYPQASPQHTDYQMPRTSPIQQHQALLHQQLQVFHHFQAFQRHHHDNVVDSSRQFATNNKRQQHQPTGGSQSHLEKPQKASSAKPKRVRTIFTPEQLKRLEYEFNNQMYLVGHDRCCLADSLNLSEAQVKVWFQNRRIKHRKLNPFV